LTANNNASAIQNFNADLDAYRSDRLYDRRSRGGAMRISQPP
jgi:hypothetical protein